MRPHFLFHPASALEAEAEAVSEEAKLAAAKRARRHAKALETGLWKMRNDPYSACQLRYGRCLELDGFNRELMIAFEYQGEQHTSWVRFFHPLEADFLEQQARDAAKVRLCGEHKIALLVIPFDCKDLEAFIGNELRRLELVFV